jgi:hypothetical protein
LPQSTGRFDAGAAHETRGMDFEAVMVFESAPCFIASKRIRGQSVP